jgi:predicted DNA-binding protein (MmcQ/YjbR family)
MAHTGKDNIPPALLEKVRKICAQLPNTSETVTWGHPTFQVVGKTFAVIEEYKGELGIALKVEMLLQDVFLKDPRFFRTPYIGNRGWITLRVHAAPLVWKEIRSLLEGSYRLVTSAKGKRS